MQIPKASTAKKAGKKQKIAILGGGIGALTTAFEITQSKDWAKNFDITIHTLGWRLGGKCATGRGPNSRIEEHGIHGFLGSYYNALPIMADVFKACDRPATHPLATFEDAFKPENFVLMWEFRNGNWLKWPLTLPSNKLNPATPGETQTIETIYRDLAKILTGLFTSQINDAQKTHSATAKFVHHELKILSDSLLAHIAEGAWKEVMEACDMARKLFLNHFSEKLMDVDAIRRLYISIDYFLALLRGAIADGVFEHGFDPLDSENFDEWLERHGAHPITISSPMALNTPNLSYQYPSGDTSRKAQMAAGAYLHWTLRSFAYLGSFAYMFRVGTGESVIAPLYDALKKRGVKFEFFNKVTDLKIAADGKSISSIDIDIQATLAKGVSEYQPMIATTPSSLDGKTLMGWPAVPNHEQLKQGDKIISENIDLESYWSPWKAVGKKTLNAGTDFDIVVYAIPVATIPYLCPDLLKVTGAVGDKWRGMVDNITTSQTQTMQVWFSETTKTLGLDFDLKGYDTVIGATYAGPINGQVDFSELIQWESFPNSNTPKSLWYFSGTMTDYEADAPPPLSDHDYPRRAHERVRYQCIQYLQAATGSLLPNATTNVNSPPGDPMSLDFDLLVCTEDNSAKGVARFDQQFYRANIDPNERYTQSPPGSTAFRVKAWDSGYDNLVLAGDWAYTGLNVGSVEGTVMSGRLASHAVSKYPLLKNIPGFLPTSP